MKKSAKLYERVFITSFMTNTKEDGEIATFLAMEGLSGKIFPPVLTKKFESIEDILNLLQRLFNTINADYNRAIHAQQTKYITDISEEFLPFMKAMILPEDSIVFDKKATKEMFKEVFEMLNSGRF